MPRVYTDRCPVRELQDKSAVLYGLLTQTIEAPKKRTRIFSPLMTNKSLTGIIVKINMKLYMKIIYENNNNLWVEIISKCKKKSDIIKILKIKLVFIRINEKKFAIKWINSGKEAKTKSILIFLNQIDPPHSRREKRKI